MNKTNKELDSLIHEALSQEDAEFFDRLGEPSILDMGGETFFGRQRQLVWFAVAFGIGLMALSVYCLIQFLNVTDVRQMLLWGAGAGASLAALTALKIWYWMELQRIALGHQIKRIELQLAQLAAEVRTALETR
jgi:hypothetical protein